MRLSRLSALAVWFFGATPALGVGSLVAGCMYPWDELRPISTGETVCSDLCATQAACLSNEPGCEGVCESVIADCPTVQRDALDDCVDDLEDHCGEVASETLYQTCLSTVPCYNN